MVKRLLASILFVIVGVIFFRCFCVERLRTNNPLFNLVFQPENLYQPLAQVPFKTSLANELYECPFTTKYPGNHAVEVWVGSPVKMLDPYNEKFIAEISIEDMEGRVLVKEEAKPPFMPFWGKDSGGLYIFRFKVPQDVPLGDPLSAYIRVKEKDVLFEDRYEPLFLRIIKVSDE